MRTSPISFRWRRIISCASWTSFLYEIVQGLVAASKGEMMINRYWPSILISFCLLSSGISSIFCIIASA